MIRVHLKGHFAPLRHAGAYWRAEAKEGRQRAARVINTSSGAGLQGSVGQATYSAAKAGIAGLTLVAAQEMGRYGVTVNAIAPVARTRMTEGAFDTSAMALPEDNSPLVAWLASEEAGDVTGRVIEIDGGTITVENGWAHGPSRDAGRRWDAAEVGPALRELLGRGADPGAGVRRLRLAAMQDGRSRPSGWPTMLLARSGCSSDGSAGRAADSSATHAVLAGRVGTSTRPRAVDAGSPASDRLAELGFDARQVLDQLAAKAAQAPARRASWSRATGQVVGEWYWHGSSATDCRAGGLLGHQVGHQHAGRHRPQADGDLSIERSARRPTSRSGAARRSRDRDRPQPALQRQRPRSGAWRATTGQLLQAPDRTCVRRGARPAGTPPGTVWVYNNAAIQTLDRGDPRRDRRRSTASLRRRSGCSARSGMDAHPDDRRRERQVDERRSSGSSRPAPTSRGSAALRPGRGVGRRAGGPGAPGSSEAVGAAVAAS